MEGLGSKPEKAKSSDLIFLELLRRGHETVEGKRLWNIADSKLWYLSPEQSQGYLDITQSPEYEATVVTKEVDLLNKVLPELALKLPRKTYNLLDLGCGDGQKAALFIKTLSNAVDLRYCPIDISSYMVQKAADTIRTTGTVGKVLEFKWNVSDFENLGNVTPLFREGEFENHVLMLLGNTLGNFDIQEILNGIKEGMCPGDFLVIGNGVIEEGADSSRLVSAYKADTISKWLSIVPKSAGFSEDEIEFSTRFRNSRIEEVYTVKTDKVLGSLGHELVFKEGDEILVAVSNKHTPYALQQEIEKYFPNSELFLNDDKTYAVVVCEFE